MTDVLILHRIPGARPGQILPLDERLERQVKAGNAQVLGGDTESDSEPAPGYSLPPVADTEAQIDSEFDRHDDLEPGYVEYGDEDTEGV